MHGQFIRISCLLFDSLSLLICLHATQVARAVEQMLGDEEGQAEQIVAVLDARQATTLQVTRKVNLIKQLALDLNQVSFGRSNHAHGGVSLLG